MKYTNTHDIVKPHVHGYAHKGLIVLHETVSGDIPGLGDILSIEKYLASKDYGIHGMTDKEGNIAWAAGLAKAVLYHAGGVNERSIGIEQVSNVMLKSPLNSVRRKIWVARNAELRATAKLIACISRAEDIPIQYTQGRMADPDGVTSHWDISQHYPASEGHTDCWPVHRGGYYPILEVIQFAKVYYAAGIHF